MGYLCRVTSGKIGISFGNRVSGVFIGRVKDFFFFLVQSLSIARRIFRIDQRCALKG